MTESGSFPLMLNHIWAGLIAISLVFALGQDVRDLATDPYRNGEIRRIRFDAPVNADLERRTPVTLHIPDATAPVAASWRPVGDGYELVIPVTDALPESWLTVARLKEGGKPDELRVTVADHSPGEAGVVLPPVRFVKMRAITAAAFDLAGTAVTLAIGLIGVMALWLGLMRIADVAGLIHVVVKGVHPFMKYLFPDVPKEHPALGHISLNLAANVLGLGNAATPLGLKAMESLQELNPDKDKASNPMIMFLALNTSSVQILPPVTLVALMGLGVNELFFSILIATACSTAAAIVFVKWKFWQEARV